MHSEPVADLRGGLLDAGDSAQGAGAGLGDDEQVADGDGAFDVLASTPTAQGRAVSRRIRSATPSTWSGCCRTSCILRPPGGHQEPRPARRLPPGHRDSEFDGAWSAEFLLSGTYGRGCAPGRASRSRSPCRSNEGQATYCLDLRRPPASSPQPRRGNRRVTQHPTTGPGDSWSCSVPITIEGPIRLRVRLHPGRHGALAAGLLVLPQCSKIVGYPPFRMNCAWTRGEAWSRGNRYS